jgi:XrtJ-associated TM-motif-TM protein
MPFAFGLTLMLALTLPLRAQSGCVDSPEDPTVILGVLAGSVFLAARVRGFLVRK